MLVGQQKFVKNVIGKQKLEKFLLSTGMKVAQEKMVGLDFKKRNSFAK